ncbi:MAG: hypothetical protein LBD67_06100 [Candidatus Accumulibacter sp.]|jgi:hypothetical protein|nr:hypothetical protein [Accumulibacter sp.]
MTELHWGLIGLGVVVVACVMIYNAWQEYRHREEFSDTGRVGDPLFGGIFGKKPKTDALDALLRPLRETKPDDRAGRIEPALEEFIDMPPAAARDGVGSSASEDTSVIDCVAEFETKKAVSARRIIELARDSLAGIQKPLALSGQNSDFLHWEPLIEEQKNGYRRFRIGVQLVDRQGAITADGLSAFHLAIRNLAEELSANMRIPGMEETLETAKKLDAFAESVDIQIGINVIAGDEVFQGKSLKHLAETEGMTLEGDGRFVGRDAEGAILYSLINGEAPVFSGESVETLKTRGITFLLDVPRTACAERAFEQMVGLARCFAAALKGTLADDRGHEVSEASLEPVREQIVRCQSAMVENRLPPGGELARRLFS